jgi:flagellar biosynthesis/type III secretory pathway chaperone
MLAALEQENQALLDGNTDGLNQVGAEKVRLMESLESLERERRLMAQLPEGALAGQSDQGHWQRLLDLMEECRRRNERNGVLVNLRREQVDQALRVLRGTELELYDASGLRSRGATSRQGSVKA